ncbi:PTS system D-mannitol-specific IIA component (Fru family) /PTS system D-mannitol-specific IIB component (Fru family) /PTS system D-mannitol-specific IIC component (Fru family) [Frigoribacterium sp. PhB160]|uniref:PTS mannitol transporter subunit IICBA n=1 Tax=Frigoribacterium sp. PhB160 TaxID=2485192 RepID=UPI000F48029C|nr:PTS mannitol transporter subunit IICBA [Frigoribacterium sp. PhB160]ROS58080.1 PTS system D-mannitol-specific IIA component (Fru family) /PTS system D-mannitol-specific IIB component (Fru family) /PTS system D-mannitol-specific IIC component (Fru family) [Frigoribacterium sp. PhB160]
MDIATTHVHPRRDRRILQRVQRFGNFLSGMVMPNLGVFVAWGLLTALFIPTGYFPNADLANLVSPIITYALPLLIGYTGGHIVHGARGGAIGALATMGVIVGSDVTMLAGAMVMGPLAAFLLKQVDRFFASRVKAGFEMLVSNFSMGILGLVIVVAGYLAIGPAFAVVLAVLSAGVNFILANDLLPLLAIPVAPGQVLFLNNAINHGIMAPLGIQQVAEQGRSILFLVDANPGPSVGTLLAITVFGRGLAKRTAPMAALIAGVGGIGEVYFPFVLMNPKLVLATMGGIATSLSMFVLFDGGTVATPSPGSIFAMLALTPKGALAGNLIGFFAGMAVAFLLAALLLKTGKRRGDDDEIAEGDALERDRINAGLASAGTAGQPIRTVVVACDAGMGSSAMGASILATKVRKAMLDVTVTNSKIEEIPKGVDLIVTHTNLMDRTKQRHDDGTVRFMAITNFVEATQFDAIVDVLRTANGAAAASAAPAAPVAPVAPVAVDPDVLSRENVELGRSFVDKEAAITAAGEILVRQGYATSAYVDAMHRRESLVTVYVGNHVAIPHGDDGSADEILRSGISVVQVPDGVAFGDEVAYVLIGIAGKDGSHLDIISRIAQVCSDEDQVERMRRATTPDEIVAILTATTVDA